MNGRVWEAVSRRQALLTSPFLALLVLSPLTPTAFYDKRDSTPSQTDTVRLLAPSHLSYYYPYGRLAVPHSRGPNRIFAGKSSTCCTAEALLAILPHSIGICLAHVRPVGERALRAALPRHGLSLFSSQRLTTSSGKHFMHKQWSASRLGHPGSRHHCKISRSDRLSRGAYILMTYPSPLQLVYLLVASTNRTFLIPSFLFHLFAQNIGRHGRPFAFFNLTAPRESVCFRCSSTRALGSARTLRERL